jgi:hypothetical protein
MTGTLHEDLCTSMTISRTVLLKMRNISQKRYSVNKNTSHAQQLFEKTVENVEKYGSAGQATDGNIIRRMCFACWINKATNTHSKYLIFIAFPR